MHRQNSLIFHCFWCVYWFGCTLGDPAWTDRRAPLTSAESSPKTKQILFHHRDRKLPLVSTGAGGYVKYHLISHVEVSWWEMLADTHTGCAALHMLACCPHNLHAIWWGTSLSPCTSGTLVFHSHWARETSVCATILGNIKESTPVRINRMATGPTSNKPGSFQVMRTLTF